MQINKIPTLFNDKKTVFSLEVFPPKKTSPTADIYDAFDELCKLEPAFISVTLGAGGSLGGHAVATAKKIQDLGVTSMAHLPCINYSKDEILTLLAKFKENGITNILALRGDGTPDAPPKTDFKYASDLVSFIKQNGDFSVSGACYPEGHFECTSLVDDVRNLKIKVDAGVEHLVTQLFFDNEIFYRFRERTEIAGISVPIEAGIMPVTNQKQIEHMVSLCGSSIPRKLANIIQKFGHNDEAMKSAGIAYAVDQITDLIANGVAGIHIYTMNKPDVASKIWNAVASLM
jgi:methylenetetrahydrofolate reductase (NADPH)